MPALRNGCVIEVSYRLISPYLFELSIPGTSKIIFQRLIPNYEVHIPGFWNYNASLKGYLKLTKNKAMSKISVLRYGTASADCSDMIYGIEDVPAFIEEDYMTSPKNYIQP